MPGLIRSPQSLMPLGLPLRTRNTIVEVYGALLSGRRLCQFSGSSLPRVAICIHITGQSQRHDIGRQSFDHRAGLFARAAVRLVDPHVLAGLRLPVARELGVVVDVQLAGRIVGDIQDGDAGRLRQRRAEQRRAQ